jgi:putative YhdH/YhfP family quinone oxidoreductase
MAGSADAFRAYRIEEEGEGGEPKGRMTTIGLSELNEGQLVVRVRYSNLNYKDALAATGAGKIAKRLPIVGGIDLAGTVVSSEDPSFEEGDEVLLTGFGLSEDRDGGYAEYARLEAEHALKLPHGLDAERAIALGTAGLTAALSVVRMEHNGLSPDEGPVAVTGATGGVGSLAVDMLSDLGYEVVAITGKGEERGYLEGLGASEVLLRQELEMGGRPLESARWAGAVDTVGGEMLGWLTRTAKKDGRVAVCGNAGGAKLETTVFPFILRGVDLLGIDSDWCDRETRRTLWKRMAKGGDLHPIHLDEMTRTIGFHELPDAFGAFLEGGSKGRTVVRLGR